MARRIVLMFPGQGSQYFHMGRELFEHFSVFRRAMVRMDHTLRELGRSSVLEQLYGDSRRPTDRFDDLLLTHPAIFMVEVALTETLLDLGLRVDAVVGASLGTYAAAVASGALEENAALAAVARQAATFQALCPAGAMIAILGDPALFARSGLAALSEMAACNYDAHFVVSTDMAHWPRVERLLDDLDTPYIKLPVDRAFHSRWIESAETHIASQLSTLTFRPPRIPFYCCAATDLLPTLGPERLWAVARQPINFQETTRAMERDGPNLYVDAGPSGTLATFLKHGLPKTSRSATRALLSPFGRDVDRLQELLSDSETVSG